MFQLFQVFLRSPITYLLGFLIGFITGLGIEFIDIGFSNLSLLKIKKMPHKYIIILGCILLFSCGILFTTAGILLFLVLIPAFFIPQVDIFSLWITLFIAVLICIIMMLPLFLRRRTRTAH